MPVPATERVYAYVKERILDGSLPGGAMTSEGEIADALQVSRTPVREAFLRLEAGGFLRLYPKRGALIVPVSPAEADEIYEARRVIESHAARVLTELPAAQLEAICDELQQIADEQRSAIATSDLAAYASADARFHHAVIEAAGNGLLTNFDSALRHRQLRLVANSVRRDSSRAEDFRSSHLELLQALRARDAQGYATILAAHLEVARRSL